MKKLFVVFVGMLTCSGAIFAAEEDTIEIYGMAGKAVPISVSGFSGEADSVLKFDLYVSGFSIVEPSGAQYQLSGSNNGRVEGRLTQAARNLLARAYNGGSTRSQAHALADDVVKQIRG